MRVISLVVLIVAGLALVTAPADAAPKRARAVVAPRAAPTRVVVRPRTRITVTRRSYLDAGTTVYPGSQQYTDYVFPPNTRTSLDIYLPSQEAQSVLPQPLWLNSYHAPSWGY